MPQPKHTVFYPAMIRWTRSLNDWSQASAKSNDFESIQQTWGSRSARIEWMKEGSRLMLSAQLSEDNAHEFMELVHTGELDPLLVSRQLREQAWGYMESIPVDVGHDREEYIVLSEQWPQMMGAVMILACRLPKTAMTPENEVELREWLSSGLDLVLPVDAEDVPNSLLWSAAHTNWLKQMCLQNSWIQEEVALGVLHVPEWLPLWSEVINEQLGAAPSLHFVRAMLNLLDETNAEESAQLFLQDQAPIFYTTISDAHRLYENLYGRKPGLSGTAAAYEEYTDGRAQATYGMLSYAGKTVWLGDSSSSPAIDKLF